MRPLPRRIFSDFLSPQKGDDPEEIWTDTINGASHFDAPYALALCAINETYALLSTPRRDGGEAPKGSKYNFNMQPLNRLLMIAAREGAHILPNCIFSSRVPSSRELVNFLGAGYDTLSVGDVEDARDDHAFQALQDLVSNEILSIKNAAFEKE